MAIDMERILFGGAETERGRQEAADKAARSAAVFNRLAGLAADETSAKSADDGGGSSAGALDLLHRIKTRLREIETARGTKAAGLTPEASDLAAAILRGMAAAAGDPAPTGAGAKSGPVGRTVARGILDGIDATAAHRAELRGRADAEAADLEARRAVPWYESRRRQ